MMSLTFDDAREKSDFTSSPYSDACVSVSEPGKMPASVSSGQGAWATLEASFAEELLFGIGVA